MKYHSILFAAASLVAFASRAEGLPNPPFRLPRPPSRRQSPLRPLPTPGSPTQRRISYAMGVMIANDIKMNLQRGGYEVNQETLLKAFSDTFAGKSPS
jgi:hypothetical protein